MHPSPDLSVVIPAYNEADRIGPNLDHLRGWLAAWDGTSEVVVVDDGSTDDTASVAARSWEGPEFRLLRNRGNQGKGYSIKHGVLLARGRFVLLSDADFSTPVEELPRLLEPVAAGRCDIAIGSRGLVDSRIEKRQPAWREGMGRCFNRLVRILTGLPYRDTQCGFKIMLRDAVLPVFRAARVTRFAYDVEILYLAAKAGLVVEEIPVIWRNDPASKVDPVFDSLVMLKDIVRIRLRDYLGRYGDLRIHRPDGAGRA